MLFRISCFSKNCGTYFQNGVLLLFTDFVFLKLSWFSLIWVIQAPNPKDWGWQTAPPDNSKYWEPVWLTVPPIQDILTTLVKCGYKLHCSRSRNCRVLSSVNAEKLSKKFGCICLHDCKFDVQKTFLSVKYETLFHKFENSRIIHWRNMRIGSIFHHREGGEGGIRCILRFYIVLCSIEDTFCLKVFFSSLKFTKYVSWGLFSPRGKERKGQSAA